MHRSLTTLIALVLLAAPLASAGAQGLPDRIGIGSLSRLYGKVDFDHARHIVLMKDCAVCHHHTAGAPSDDPYCGRCHAKGSEQLSKMSCKSCHTARPFTAENLRQREQHRTTYHIDKPGLSGAYHRSCVGCHTKMNGPVGCTDCHERTQAGDETYRSGAFTPAATGKKSGHH